VVPVTVLNNSRRDGLAEQAAARFEAGRLAGARHRRPARPHPRDDRLLPARPGASARAFAREFRGIERVLPACRPCPARGSPSWSPATSRPDPGTRPPDPASHRHEDLDPYGLLLAARRLRRDSSTLEPGGGPAPRRPGWWSSRPPTARRPGPSPATLPAATTPAPPGPAGDLASAEDPFAPLPDDVICTELYGGDQTARVTGTYRGQPVDLELSRVDGCRIAQWDGSGALLPGPVGVAPVASGAC
jgi:hypothetical protein